MSFRFAPDRPYAAVWPVLVRCPRCDACAIVGGGHLDGARPIRLTCPACGLFRTWSGMLLRELPDGTLEALHPSPRYYGQWLDPSTGRSVGTPNWPAGREPYFGAPFWLLAECCGGQRLWARNLDDLARLQRIVAAREDRPHTYRLPKWMLSAAHRDEVLGQLERLRDSVPAAGAPPSGRRRVG